MKTVSPNILKYAGDVPAFLAVFPKSEPGLPLSGLHRIVQSVRPISKQTLHQLIGVLAEAGVLVKSFVDGSSMVRYHVDTSKPLPEFVADSAATPAPAPTPHYFRSTNSEREIKRDTKMIACIRTMPPLLHLNEGTGFNIADSAVVKWMISQPDVLQALFRMAQKSGAITFDASTGLWSGVRDVWRPMSEAPTDQPILASVEVPCAAGIRVCARVIHSNAGSWVGEDDVRISHYALLGWMPIPALVTSVVKANKEIES
jgi:hypothetical protein